jgi:hypothetical protein
METGYLISYFTFLDEYEDIKKVWNKKIAICFEVVK